MKSASLLIHTILFLTIVLTGCKKESSNRSDDTEFCAFISNGEYNNTGVIIDKYLKRLNNNLTDIEKLEQIRDWLKEKTCVSSAEIICSSCIYTYPAQSELRVRFIVNGQEVEKVLDITMDEPLRFGTFHE